VLLESQDDLSWLSREAPALVEEIRSAVEDVRRQRFTGATLDDGVSATVNGLGALLDVSISTLAKRGTDNLTLGEAVVAAVASAEAAAKAALADRLATLTFAGRALTPARSDFLKDLSGLAAE
jgi:DNA-binding protein YbaB